MKISQNHLLYPVKEEIDLAQITALLERFSTNVSGDECVDVTASIIDGAAIVNMRI